MKARITPSLPLLHASEERLGELLVLGTQVLHPEHRLDLDLGLLAVSLRELHLGPVESDRDRVRPDRREVPEEEAPRDPGRRCRREETPPDP